MKKIVKVCLLLLAIIFIADSAIAQARFGVHAGLNFANIKEKYYGSTTQESVLPTILVGGFVDIDITEILGIQTGLDLVGKGTQVKYEGGKDKTSLLYLQAPVMLRYKRKGFFAGAGLSLGMGLTGKYKYPDDPSDKIYFGADSDNDDFRRVELGGVLEAGWQASSGFRASALFGTSLNNLSPDGDSTVRHNAFTLSVGYLFSRKEAGN